MRLGQGAGLLALRGPVMRGLHILEQAHYKPGDPAPSGYLAWHEWSGVQHKAGLRQKQCGRCGLWCYPQQLTAEVLRWDAKTSRGEMVRKEAPVCSKCHKPPNVMVSGPR